MLTDLRAIFDLRVSISISVSTSTSTSTRVMDDYARGGAVW